MASDDSLKVSLHKHIRETSEKLQKLVSSKSIPIWVNPNNSRYYEANPYQAGDVVILLSNVDDIYYLLREYYEKIAENLGLDISIFKERNNPELNNEDLINSVIYGGFLTKDKYINPLTVVSTSKNGYGIYVSLKDNNYDIPGISDSWFNLDMSESLSTMQLQLARIVSILTSKSYINDIKGKVPDGGDGYGNIDDTYLNNRIDYHNYQYHFGEGAQYITDNYNTQNDIIDKLAQIEAEIKSNTNTTTSVLKNPFIFNGKIVGESTTILQTTGQMNFYCILNVEELPRDKNLTISFVPSKTSNILCPIVLRDNSGIIAVDDPSKDKCVEIDTNVASEKYAWYVDSFVKVTNDDGIDNNIIINTNVGYTGVDFKNYFSGFKDKSYIATFTPIGNTTRTENISIYGSPVREISRSKIDLVFQIRSDYVWNMTGLAIALTGKCEV